MDNFQNNCKDSERIYWVVHLVTTVLSVPHSFHLTSNAVFIFDIIFKKYWLQDCTQDLGKQYQAVYSNIIWGG